MLKVYVDESGNLGYNKGYFIIAMLITKNSQRLKNIIKSFCAENQLEEVHATDLNFQQKQYLINKLVKVKDYEVYYIVLDKTQVKNRNLYRNNNLLFNYLFSHLVKDFIKNSHEDISIILDNRTQKVASLNSLEDYIKIKAFTEWNFNRQLRIEYMDSKRCVALQASDLVANSIWRNYYWNISDFYNQINVTKSIKFPYYSFRY